MRMNKLSNWPMIEEIVFCQGHSFAVHHTIHRVS